MHVVSINKENQCQLRKGLWRVFFKIKFGEKKNIIFETNQKRTDLNCFSVLLISYKCNGKFSK